MKSYIKYLFFAMLSAASLLACQTPPRQTALTPAILERIEKLEKPEERNLRNYPFILSGPIMLHTVRDGESSQNTTPPKIRRDGEKKELKEAFYLKILLYMKKLVL